MPLFHEIYVEKIANLMEAECESVREDMGLNPTNVLDCVGQSCNSQCPFREGSK